MTYDVRIYTKPARTTRVRGSGRAHGSPSDYRAHLKAGEPACEACSEANNAYHRRYRKERDLGYPDRTVPIEEVRGAIEDLFAMGHSKATLARASGISPMTLNSIMYARGRKRAGTRYLQALLNTDGPALEDLPLGRQVDPTGTRRRLQGLVWQGWPISEIARQVEMNESALNKVCSGRATTVEVRTALAVRKVTRRIGHSPLPGHLRPRDVRAAKGRARERGWAPLASWDDPDDPRERPKGVA